MKIVGINFTKIFVEKNEIQTKEVKVNSGMNIKNIEKYKSPIKTKESFLKLDWFYEIIYSDNLAKINIEGNLIISLDEKKQKEVLSDWKNEKLKNEFNLPILNFLLTKCNIKSLQLEEDFNLPPHFNLPSLKNN